MKRQSLFSRKVKKTIIILSPVELAQRVIKVNKTRCVEENKVSSQSMVVSLEHRSMSIIPTTVHFWS